MEKNPVSAMNRFRCLLHCTKICLMSPARHIYPKRRADVLLRDNEDLTEEEKAFILSYTVTDPPVQESYAGDSSPLPTGEAL